MVKTVDSIQPKYPEAKQERERAGLLEELRSHCSSQPKIEKVRSTLHEEHYSYRGLGTAASDVYLCVVSCVAERNGFEGWNTTKASRPP
jgi:hypothetical protein